MLLRILAGGAMALGGALFVGLLVFGAELPDYLVTSAGSFRNSVKPSAPLELELQRAREMLDAMMPEIQAKILVVAHEEVEVTALRKRIKRNGQQLDSRADHLQALRQLVESQSMESQSMESQSMESQSMESQSMESQVISTNHRPINQHERDRHMRRLRITFDQYRESEDLLASQRELLRTREASLRAATAALEDYRAQKALIEQRIESLASRHQLVEARSTMAPHSRESGSLTQINELLTEVEKRVEIANRVLDHEYELLPVETIPYLDEADLLAEVDRYLESPIGTLNSEAVEVIASDDEVERVIE